MTERARLKILQSYMILAGIAILFWWPLSHWLYPAWYHNLLGFPHPEQYAGNPLVIVIGLTGFIPVLLLIFAAIDPIRNRDMVKVLIAFGYLGCLVFGYLVQNGYFPRAEYLNVVLLACSATILALLYPRQRKS